MYAVQQYIIDKHHPLFDYLDSYSLLSKNLYNAALYRIRQIYTGWDATPRNQNQEEVFFEVHTLESVNPAINVRQFIGYSHLEKLMRVTSNPDFFSGLPMQTAQWIINHAVQNYKNWFAALKAYSRDPGKFLGKPHMPGYKKTCSEFAFTNQDAVIYPDKDGYCLKLPKTNVRLRLRNTLPGRLVETHAVPYYGRFIVSLTFDIEDVPRTDNQNIAAIDFGTHNIAAIVCNDGSSRLYKGGAVLSENRWFAKQRARYTGIITKGHEHIRAQSERLCNLSFHHANFNRDQLHKISRDIIRFCEEHCVGTLVLGVSKNWKQGSAIGHVNNQKFVQMPIAKLIWMIQYKCAMSGIMVVEQEESYTSKASFIDHDYIPVYGAESEDAPVFSGKRIGRGLYVTQNGIVVNADLNGAANILKKAFPSAWDNILSHATENGFPFLKGHDVSGFHELNPSSIAVKRIAAV